MNNLNTRQTERLSTTRSPYSNGTNYSYWKTRIRIFLFSTQLDVWQIILSGHQDPIIIKDSWSQQQKKAHTINSKAMNALYCTLNETELNSISLYQSAKEICDFLEVTHESISQGSWQDHWDGGTQLEAITLSPQGMTPQGQSH